MLAVFLGYAPADRAVASALREFLERAGDARVIFDEGEMRPGENAVTKARDGLVADAILILWSPEAEPARRSRGEFAAAFWDGPRAAGVEFGTALARDCWYPPLLERENFFDLRQSSAEMFRAVKRWLRGIRPRTAEIFFAPDCGRPEGFDQELAILAERVADRVGAISISGPPGCGQASLAARFAEIARLDFDAVLWTRGARPEARIAGDLGFQTGASATADTLEENWRRLRPIFDERRCLVVLDETARPVPETLLGCARTSVIAISEEPVLESRIELSVVRETPEKPPDALRRARALLHSSLAWDLAATEWERDLPLLLDAVDALLTVNRAEAWRRACDLGRRAVQLTKARQRVAELREIVDRMVAEAVLRGDAPVESEFAWEYCWLPGASALAPVRQGMDSAEQLTLFG